MKNSHKNRSGEKLPLWKALAVLIIAVLITIGITAIAYSFYKILGYTEYEMKVKITDKNDLGFNLEPGVLNFGKVPRGASSLRNATVSQKFPFDINVRIETEGNIKDMVFIKDNYFVLPSNSTKKIEVVLNAPENQTLGNYSGKLKVYFERQ